MTKSEARTLCNEIKANGIYCTIPRGESLPRIFTCWGCFRFASREEWLSYLKDKTKREMLADLLYSDRTPIQIAVDEACGITKKALDEADESLIKRARAF